MGITARGPKRPPIEIYVRSGATLQAIFTLIGTGDRRLRYSTTLKKCAQQFGGLCALRDLLGAQGRRGILNNKKAGAFAPALLEREQVSGHAAAADDRRQAESAQARECERRRFRDRIHLKVIH